MTPRAAAGHSAGVAPFLTLVPGRRQRCPAEPSRAAHGTDVPRELTFDPVGGRHRSSRFRMTGQRTGFGVPEQGFVPMTRSSAPLVRGCVTLVGGVVAGTDPGSRRAAAVSEVQRRSRVTHLPPKITTLPTPWGSHEQTDIWAPVVAGTGNSVTRWCRVHLG